MYKYVIVGYISSLHIFYLHLVNFSSLLFQIYDDNIKKSDSFDKQ